MSNLTQPITATTPEVGYDAANALTLENFLALLKEEEDYWTGEEKNTRLLISHLRKIFYDRWGWNEQLITGARNVARRYEVNIVEAAPQAAPAAPDMGNAGAGTFVKKVYSYKKRISVTEVNAIPQGAKRLTLFRQDNFEPKSRNVVYAANDKVHPELAGTTPKIYADNHQEVRLPDGTICDIGHVLAGLDASNHLRVVTPAHDIFNFLKCFMPHLDHNTDIVTWLGDIASSAGNFLFYYRQKLKDPNVKKKENTPEEEQNIINGGAPGSDMLGDIDAYVIAKHFEIGSTNGQRVTEILKEYYLGTATGPSLRAKRYSTFAHAVGLRGWNADKNRFDNELHWLSYYRRQLRDNTCFQVKSLMNGSWRSYWLVIRIWCNGFTKVLKLETLLAIFLKALKEKIKQEPKP